MIKSYAFDLPKYNFKTLNYRDLGDKFSVNGTLISTLTIEQKKAGYTEDMVTFMQTGTIPTVYTDFANSLFDRNYVSISKQPVGKVLPSHVDQFYNICKKYNVTKNECVRFIICLEDWKSGHYLEVNNEPFINWKAGSGFLFTCNDVHLSGNFGLVPKYTMQITGLIKELKV